VHLALFFEQLEICSEQCGDALTIVSADRQPAATFGTLGRERRDDDVATAPHRPCGQPGIRFLARRLGNKMKYGSVVPDIDLGQRRILRDIANDP
jgi:hypothetical protein